MKKIFVLLSMMFLVGCQTNQNFDVVNESITIAKEVTENIDLPTEIQVNEKTYVLTWSSNMKAYLNESGEVNRPHFSDGDKLVTLTVGITYGGRTKYFTHEVLVKALEDEVSTFQVTYFDQDSVLFSETYHEGQSLVKPTNPTKTGYKFNGWFVDQQFNDAFSFNQRIFNDIKVYAQFTKLETNLFSDEFDYTSTTDFLSVWTVLKEGTYELNNHLKVYEGASETSFMTTFDALESGRYIIVFDFIQGSGGASFTIEALHDQDRLFTVGANRQNRYTYRLSGGNEYAIPLSVHQVIPKQPHQGVVVVDMDNYVYKYFVTYNQTTQELTPKGGLSFMSEQSINGLKIRTAGSTSLSSEPFMVIDKLFIEESSTRLNETSPHDPEQPINWAEQVEVVVSNYQFYSEVLTYNLTLPSRYEGVNLTWTSSNPSVLSARGEVFRSDEDQSVTLTLTGDKDEFTFSKTFDFIVKAQQPETPFTLEHFNVVGFAQDHVSIPDIAETDPRYIKVYNELDFIKALALANTKTTQSAKIIEIMNDLNLGYQEVINKYPIVETDYRSVFQSHNAPSLHPILLETGISKVRIEERNDTRDKYGSGLMIFSKGNYTIKHATFHVKRSNNIIFRNLTFDELWEWDEQGDYDGKDWDYFTIEAVHGIWFDHITLNKAYDGLIDFKYGTPSVTGATFSYLTLNFQPNDFIKTQLLHFEANGGSSKYKTLRNNSMTIDEITKLVSFQKKGFLLGGSAMKPNITELTIYNSTIINLQDRFPRLRGDVDKQGGDVHVFNNYYDASDIAAFKRDAETKYNRILLNANFTNMLTNQAIVTTENGAILVENTIFKGVTQVIKSNQTSNGEAYTGKFLVLNSLYALDDYQFIGSSLDANTPFKPSNSDPIIPFSFNAFDQLPYTYQDRLIDVVELESYLLKMADTTQINWLKTTQ